MALGIVVLVALVTSLVVVELNRLEWQRLLTSKRGAAQLVAVLFAGSLAPALDFKDDEAVRDRVGGLKVSPEILQARILANGRSEIIAEYRKPREPECSEPDCIEVLHPVVSPTGEQLGTVQLKVSLNQERDAFAQTRRRMMGLGAVFSLALASALILIARRFLVTPLGRLETAAMGLARGLPVLVPVQRDDEIGRLSRTFNSMAQIIDDRERRVAASNRRLQNLLDHMGQAILVFDSRGKLTEEHSRLAARIFGATAGSNVVDQVYPNLDDAEMEREAFQAWIEAAAGASDLAQFKELVDLAPRSIKFRQTDGELELDLEYRLVDGGRAQQIMLLATDVTEQRRLERSVAQKELEHERQLSAVRRLVSGGGQLFAAFMDHTQRRLGVCRELLNAHPTLDRGTVEALFQQFHTLRAEARCFDLASIEARVTQLEALLQELRAGDTDQSGGQEVRQGVDELAQLLTDAKQTFVAQHPLGAAALDQITVRRTRFVELLDASKPLQGSVRTRIEELAKRPLVESTALLPEAVARWAQRAGKQLRLEVDHGGVEIPYALAGVLGGVLSHLLRNAIAHGIEPEAEREAAGKPRLGVVRISGVESDGGVVISVADDGAGFNIDAIRARARGVSPQAILALSEAFESGTSTIVNRGELAGAGVGLAAARAELASAGYCIRIASTSRQGTELRLTPISDVAPVSTGLAARNA
jgi:HAMP domain-containing protein/HPt (histidine-containing phosphotransfer) domain-containing protein/anti-sigma regulatory factor (Ser/Thr protein kinase)